MSNETGKDDAKRDVETIKQLLERADGLCLVIDRVGLQNEPVVVALLSKPSIRRSIKQWLQTDYQFLVSYESRHEGQSFSVGARGLERLYNIIEIAVDRANQTHGFCAFTIHIDPLYLHQVKTRIAQAEASIQMKKDHEQGAAIDFNQVNLGLAPFEAFERNVLAATAAWSTKGHEFNFDMIRGAVLNDGTLVFIYPMPQAQPEIRQLIAKDQWEKIEPGDPNDPSSEPDPEEPIVRH